MFLHGLLSMRQRRNLDKIKAGKMLPQTDLQLLTTSRNADYTSISEIQFALFRMQHVFICTATGGRKKWISRTMQDGQSFNSD